MSDHANRLAGKLRMIDYAIVDERTGKCSEIVPMVEIEQMAKLLERSRVLIADAIRLGYEGDYDGRVYADLLFALRQLREEQDG